MIDLNKIYSCWVELQEAGIAISDALEAVKRHLELRVLRTKCGEFYRVRLMQNNSFVDFDCPELMTDIQLFEALGNFLLVEKDKHRDLV